MRAPAGNSPKIAMAPHEAKRWGNAIARVAMRLRHPKFLQAAAQIHQLAGKYGTEQPPTLGTQVNPTLGTEA